MGTHALHNDNFLPLVYTLNIDINLLDLNPAYPKEPETPGEKLRKARMDKNMLIREFAELMDVSKDTVINWEKRGTEARGRYLTQIQKFIEG